MPSLPDIARATVDRHHMLPDGMPVLLMVSGGADSTALLRLLADGELGERAVRALHVNHMLRGEDADADEAFVAGLCEQLGVSCRVVRYDVSAYAVDEGLNLEDAGRRVRYRFAAEELDALAGADDGRIASAHTLDDRTETVLMRLASGSGPRALFGIRPVRGRLVRPMIDARRMDVIGYLEELGQEWREDATNADTRRVRASIRLEVLPVLRAINPRFDESLHRTLTILGDEDSLLEEMACGFTDAFAEVGEGQVILDVPLMRTLTRPMARRVVREALWRTFPEAARHDFEHIEALVDGLAQDRFAHDLSFGLHAVTEYGRMTISRPQGAVAPLAPTLLDIPGEADLGEAGVIKAEAAASPEVVGDGRSVVVVDASRLQAPLVVDGPREGDRMHPLGMEGTKKLADILSEARVPRRQRPGSPVVRSGEDVVWLAGVRLSEDFRVTPETTDAVRLSWRRQPRGEEASTECDAP